MLSRLRRPALTPPGPALIPPVGVPVVTDGAPVTCTKTAFAPLHSLTHAVLTGHIVHSICVTTVPHQRCCRVPVCTTHRMKELRHAKHVW